MVMNKKLQISKLKKLVGTKADLFDFESHVDGRLTFEENASSIKRKLRAIGLLKATPKKKAVRSSKLVSNAMSINMRRSKRSKAIDGSRKAKKTFEARTLNKKEFIKWTKNKQKYDIEGVDSVGTHFKKTKITKTQAKRFLKTLDLDDDLF